MPSYHHMQSCTAKSQNDTVGITDQNIQGGSVIVNDATEMQCTGLQYIKSEKQVDDYNHGNICC